MSAFLDSSTLEMDASYAADFGRDREPMKKRSRHPDYRRKGSAPTRVSGMHCRRNKRWTWGSGRGARVANLRAFAGCVAIAVASLATNAHAVSFDWANISGTNAAYMGNSAFTSGVGSVGYAYRMSKEETTRGQYAAFLNAVATGTSAPAYVQSLWSGTGTGITRSVSGSSYTYSVSGNADNPVSNVTWTNAARFVNWLNNNQQSSTDPTTLNTVLNTGAYTLLTTNTGSTVTARNAGMTTPGAQPKYFLPSADEWIKAAFYNPGSSSYTTWQYGATQPTATSVAGTGTNSAVYNTGVPSPGYAALPVGSLPNSMTAYGLYDMLGNVTEMTDTAGAGNAWYAVSGGFATSQGAMNSSPWNIDNTRFLTAVGSANGFRVAGVAAVPEPGSIVMASIGMAGLCGAGWLKRRRKAVAPMASAADPIAV